MAKDLNSVTVRFNDSELAALRRDASKLKPKLTPANFLRQLRGLPPLKPGAPKGNKNARKRPRDGQGEVK